MTVRLSTADGSLAVAIGGAEPESRARSFRFTERAAASSPERTCFYQLPDTSQNAYLDMFQALARDFDLRMPTSRAPLTSRASDVRLRPLLNESISPDILYGYGDPSVLRVFSGHRRNDASYYVVVTSNDAPESFPILRSSDLRAWELAGFVFPRENKPAWAAALADGGEYWAPEIHLIGERYVVCFAARERAGSLAIGLASATAPDGPYAPAESPLVREGAIDPHLFVDDDGSTTLFWKADNNDVWPSLLSGLVYDHPGLIDVLFPERQDGRTARFNALLWPWLRRLGPMERFFVQQVLIEAVSSDFQRFTTLVRQTAVAANDSSVTASLESILNAMQTTIYAQPLDAERLALSGERTAVLHNDLPWEGHLVEGVWVTKQHDRYFLFYSGNDFSSAQYGIGVAVAGSILGPYRKRPLPLLRSTPQWWGPGHASVAVGPDGRPWLFFHAYRPGIVGYKQFRALLGQPLRFGQEGVSFAGARLEVRPGVD